MPKPSPKLTELQRRFVEAYMGEARGNATEAARLAGYKGNDVTLASIGYENLQNPKIRAAIEERHANDPLTLKREEAQAILAAQARVDPSDPLTARLLEIATGEPVEALVIDGVIAANPDGTDVKLPAKTKEQIEALRILRGDRNKAIELLGKMLGWFSESKSKDDDALERLAEALKG